MNISFNTKTALTLMSVDFGIKVMEEINEYIDDSIIPANIDASGNLVGQINRNENSAQLILHLSQVSES